jgi:hypothetical protein
MPTDERRLPLMPIPSWQRPPTTRDRKGQWMAGVSGNPRGRPTNARLAATARKGITPVIVPDDDKDSVYDDEPQLAGELDL